MPNMTDWMSNIDNAALLKDIVMPGSHDAGVWAGPQPNVLVTNLFMPMQSIAAQFGDIRQQAEAGSRWFDIRMFKTPTRWSPLEKSLRPNTLGGHKMKLRAAHVPAFQEGAISKGVLQSPGLGGYGASIEQILDQALWFVSRQASATEFLVIRFSHCPEPKKVLKEISYYIADGHKHHAGHILRRSTPHVMATLGNTPISALRGKVALIFDEMFQKYVSNTDYSDWLFTYSKDIQGNAHACCCGSYADSPDTQVVKNASLAAAEKHLIHGNANGHLCFVYWQLTQRSIAKQMTGGGNIQANTVKIGGAGQQAGTHAETDDLMTQLAALQQRRLLNLNGAAVAANVISHDFVQANVSQKIVKGNTACTAPWPLNW